jgi:hypothetical protein
MAKPTENRTAERFDKTAHEAALNVCDKAVTQSGVVTIVTLSPDALADCIYITYRDLQEEHDALCEALEGVLGQLEIAICSAGFEAVESYVENAKAMLAAARGEKAEAPDGV